MDTYYELIIKWLIVLMMVLLGGLITGLTLGLMSLSLTKLQILLTSGNSSERYYASLILPIRSKGHLLLVTFLLASTLTFESLPILMEPLLGGGLTAIILSTLLTLVFGEVVPQAIISRHGLWFGAMFAKPVQVLIWLFFVVAYPIATLLDWLLGEDHELLYERSELKELVNIHSTTQGQGGTLTSDEVTIIVGALELREKTVDLVMTSLQHVFMLNINTILDWKILRDIQRAGYTRIPIYEGSRNNIIGVLLTKSLILLDPEERKTVKDVGIYNLPKVKFDLSLFELLNEFQMGASHMAIVLGREKDSSEPVGIVTLEDVIEELIQEEIIDETDVYIDVPKKIRAVRAVSGALRLNRTSTMGSSHSQYNTFKKQRALKGMLTNSPKKDIDEIIKRKDYRLGLNIEDNPSESEGEQQPLISKGENNSPSNNVLRKKIFSKKKIVMEPLMKYPTQETEFNHHEKENDHYINHKNDKAWLRPGTEADQKWLEEERKHHPNHASVRKGDDLDKGFRIGSF